MHAGTRGYAKRREQCDGVVTLTLPSGTSLTLQGAAPGTTPGMQPRTLLVDGYAVTLVLPQGLDLNSHPEPPRPMGPVVMPQPAPRGNTPD